MLKKNLLKLGLIVTVSTVITTACMVGCSPSENQIQGKPLLSNPFEDVLTSEEKEKLNDSLDDFQKEVSATIETIELEEENERKVITDTPEETTEEVSVNESLEKATVVRVVDGDTYLVRMGEEEVKVRLIGVDTPESVASEEYLERTGKENTDFGKDVSDYMKGKLKEGDTILLEFDVDKYDKYDRVLAYAYFEDGTMIQKHLLEKGFAQVMTIQPNVAHSEEFVKIEQKAMEEGVGMWEGYAELFEDEQDMER